MAIIKEFKNWSDIECKWQSSILGARRKADLVWWEPLPMGWYEFISDGMARGKPGSTSIGLLRSEKKDAVWNFLGLVGIKDTYEAET